ncbi:glutathione S-transferase T1 isoform X3 [Capsicum annuum]|uniref:glutathione S-transferase T1 isoform X3 n=1 Tax=Capsicum annuum TaxID=4072 RepID=UPI001FB053FF|nr:glutathione S-transferase T1 isoform X3 [Capsicum annuum]
MTLKLYVDHVSHHCREVIIFCKLNGIDFEEVLVDLSKRQHLNPEYKEVNPIMQIPAIMDGKFKLSESHAIIRYLASVFPIADHWYPTDLYKRAKIESVLDWHRTNFPRGPAGFVSLSLLAPAVGMPLNPQAAAKAEKVLIASLAQIESVWLQKKGRFLLGSGQPSVADLSLACEIMQLEFSLHPRSFSLQSGRRDDLGSDLAKPSWSQSTPWQCIATS